MTVLGIFKYFTNSQFVLNVLFIIVSPTFVALLLYIDSHGSENQIKHSKGHLYLSVLV